jgi:hypothetical protein
VRNVFSAVANVWRHWRAESPTAVSSSVSAVRESELEQLLAILERRPGSTLTFPTSATRVQQNSLSTSPPPACIAVKFWSSRLYCLLSLTSPDFLFIFLAAHSRAIGPRRAAAQSISPAQLNKTSVSASQQDDSSDPHPATAASSTIIARCPLHSAQSSASVHFCYNGRHHHCPFPGSSPEEEHDHGICPLHSCQQLALRFSHTVSLQHLAVLAGREPS